MGRFNEWLTIRENTQERILLQDTLRSVRQTLHNLLAHGRSMKIDWSEPAERVRKLIPMFTQHRNPLDSIFRTILSIGEANREYAIGLHHGLTYDNPRMRQMADQFERHSEMQMRQIDQLIASILGQ